MRSGYAQAATGPGRSAPIQDGGQSTAPAAERPSARELASRSGFPSVMLDYVRDTPMRIRGPVTGQPYEFSGAGGPQSIDTRDAAVLVRNPLFRMAAA